MGTYLSRKRTKVRHCSSVHRSRDDSTRGGRLLLCAPTGCVGMQRHWYYNVQRLSHTRVVGQAASKRCGVLAVLDGFGDGFYKDAEGGECGQNAQH